MRIVSMYRNLRSRIAKRLYKGSYPPGHFYSPIPDIEYVRKHETSIFNDSPPLDVDLNEKAQLEFMESSLPAYRQYPFPPEQNGSYRYYSTNDYFNITDSLCLFLIFDRFKPKKIIEVGSGFSSACMLDIYEHHLKYAPQITFIEPYSERLRSLLTPKDLRHSTLVEKMVQDVDKSIFKELHANDILFIDSSHVSKVGSDPNYLLFEVLPLLNKGVIIHFHDICYPFEYPKSWIYDGIYWNETYLLRAFLMNNRSYSILLFNHFLGEKHRAWLSVNMPLFLSGGSLWLQKQ
jgi:hypothetical protein